MPFTIRRARPWKVLDSGRFPRKKRANWRQGKLSLVRPSLELLEHRNLLSTASVNAVYGQTPLSFEPNVGQTDSQFNFVSHGGGYTLLLNSTGAVLGLQPAQASASPAAQASSPTPTVLQMQLVGANPNAPASGLDQQSGVTNYFIGNDPSQWHANVPNFAQTQFQGVYPGVDVVYYGNQSQLEYDFRVAPGANPSDIQLRFTGAQGISLDGAGNLVLHTAAGDVVEHAPVLYQQVNGVRQAVAGSYVIEANGQVGFHVGSYDTSRELTIDPVLSYSTYLGGSKTDSAGGIAVDSAGNAYITGTTQSTDFPIVNGFQTSLGSATQVAFVAKLNPAGTALVYSTYLGGSGSSSALAIVVDSSGVVTVVGQTSSTNFPTLNPLQPANGGGIDGFVTKLNATGSALLYSTYLGGNSTDQPTGLAVDSSGNMYIGGVTGSANFPLANAIQTTAGGAAPFITEINAAGTALVFSTYLGSGSCSGIAVDGAGAIYVCGNTSSTNFPVTANAILSFAPNSFSTGFVAKLSPGGASLVYSTYLGGNTTDSTAGIAVDSAGDFYVSGDTYSTNFPTANAFQTTLTGGQSAYVAKFDPSGSTLLYSTYLGGNNFTFGIRVVLDSAGDAYVVGETDATNFPTVNAIQAANAGTATGFTNDAFISELDPAGVLVFSTYLGGNTEDGASRASA